MGRKTSLAVLLVAIILAVGFLIPSDVFADLTNLTKPEVLAVEDCQKAIKNQGRKFVDKKLELVEECLNLVLKSQLRYENGKISETEFNSEVAIAQTICGKKFTKIGEASTTLVNSIIAACEVADASSVFTYTDPLGFQALANILCISIDTPTQLAGAICKEKEAIVDVAVFTQVPRMGELLTTLGSDFYIDLGGVLIPKIILDSNCRITTNDQT